MRCRFVDNGDACYDVMVRKKYARIQLQRPAAAETALAVSICTVRLTCISELQFSSLIDQHDKPRQQQQRACLADSERPRRRPPAQHGLARR